MIFVGFICTLVTGSLGQYAEIKAMEYAPPSVIMPFFYLSVIGGMIIDVNFFGS